MTHSKILISVGGLLLSGAAIVWAVRVPPPQPSAAPGPAALPEAIVPQKTAAELQALRGVFYQADVHPTLVASDKRNREAAERCVASLEKSFAGYRSGIAPFCKEINRWGTRLGVVRRMPSDWWYEETDVNEYINEKFGRHLFTDEKLTTDIQSALDQFRADVQANQKTMLTEILAAVQESDLPDLPDEIDMRQFAADTSERFQKHAVDSAEASLVRGITIEAASMAGGSAVQMLIGQLVLRASAMGVTSVAGAGGATAGGAAAGGGGGTLLGPAGTVAGLAAGVAAGLVIDWWMSARFEAQMTEQLGQMIDDLSNTAIDGSEDHPGLRDGLRGSCDLMLQTYDAVLRDRIVGEVGS